MQNKSSLNPKNRSASQNPRLANVGQMIVGSKPTISTKETPLQKSFKKLFSQALNAASPIYYKIIYENRDNIFNVCKRSKNDEDIKFNINWYINMLIKKEDEYLSKVEYEKKKARDEMSSHKRFEEDRRMKEEKLKMEEDEHIRLLEKNKKQEIENKKRNEQKEALKAFDQDWLFHADNWGFEAGNQPSGKIFKSYEVIALTKRGQELKSLLEKEELSLSNINLNKVTEFIQGDIENINQFHEAMAKMSDDGRLYFYANRKYHEMKRKAFENLSIYEFLEKKQEFKLKFKEEFGEWP